MKTLRHPPLYLAWIVWGLGASFYFAGFYQRVAPAVMTDQLMADFNIGAAALGNLSAFYFYSYVAMQIPTGVLADSLGPRRLLALGSLTATLGTFLFAVSPSILWANLGRLLIGGSVAVAYVSLLKLSVHWFPPYRFAMVSGVALFCGLAGAVSAGVPLRFLVVHFGWRTVMFMAAAATLAVCAAIWFVVRDDPSEKGFASYAPAAHNPVKSSTRTILTGLGTVFRYKNTWLLSLTPSGIVGPVLAFSGLWGVPFLSTRYGLSQSDSAAITSTLLIAWAVGGPVSGILSDRIGRRKILYLSGCIVATVGWVLALFVPGLPVWLFTVLAVAVGLASGVMVTGFAFLKESVPPPLAGTAAGVCNMGVMLGPMILQPAMGWLLDRNWQGVMENGVRIYDAAAYRSGFVLMLGWSIAACLLIAFTTETNCRQMVE